MESLHSRQFPYNLRQTHGSVPVATQLPECSAMPAEIRNRSRRQTHGSAIAATWLPDCSAICAVPKSLITAPGTAPVVTEASLEISAITAAKNEVNDNE